MLENPYEILELTKVSQGRFGRMVGAERVTVNTWVKGRHKPTPRMRKRVSAALAALTEMYEKGQLPPPPYSLSSRIDALLAPVTAALPPLE